MIIAKMKGYSSPRAHAFPIKKQNINAHTPGYEGAGDFQCEIGTIIESKIDVEQGRNFRVNLFLWYGHEFHGTFPKVGQTGND